MSKTEQAYDLLKKDILAGELLPDERLTISALKTRYGFGWTPLRDALSRLEGEKLVMLLRNRGYRVAGASLSDLRHIQRARLTIETDLLSDSIRNGDDDWEKHLLFTHRALSRVPVLQHGMSLSDYGLWEKAHKNFHLAIIGGSANVWLSRFARQLHEQVSRHQRLIVLGKQILMDPQSGEELSTKLQSTSLLDHHTLLMDAALDRDEAKATELLKEHIGLNPLSQPCASPQS